MKKVLLLLSLSTFVLAGEAIRSGSKVYVTPTKNDFDRYLMAEIQRQGLPLVLVTNRDEAEYIVTVNPSSNKGDLSQRSISLSEHNAEVETICVINRKTEFVIFTDTVREGNTREGEKSTAELCTKHLRKYIKRH